jgi:hypothetical protein
MTDIFRALLVDPAERSVTAITFGVDDTTGWRKLIGVGPDDSLDHAIIRHDPLNPVTLCVFVEGFGYYRQPPPAWWRFEGYQNPLAGRSIVYAVDERGETVDVPDALEDFRPRVTWLGFERPTDLPKSAVMKNGEIISEVDHNAADKPQSAAETYSRLFGSEPASEAKIKTPAELAYWIWEHRERMPMFVVYAHHPEHKFVAVLWLSLPSPERQDVLLASPNIDALRDQLAGLGMTHLSRSEKDDPNILEIWL